MTKVGRERIKGEIEPITRQEWETAGSQEVSESVDEMLCHVLCSGAERVSQGGSSCEDRWPATTTPPAAHSAASCAAVVQLEVLEVLELEVAEKARVQRLSVHGLRARERRVMVA